MKGKLSVCFPLDGVYWIDLYKGRGGNHVFCVSCFLYLSFLICLFIVSFFLFVSPKIYTYTQFTIQTTRIHYV